MESLFVHKNEIIGHIRLRLVNIFTPLFEVLYLTRYVRVFQPLCLDNNDRVIGKFD